MFKIENYPKSYGNIKKGYYRLKEFETPVSNMKNIDEKFKEFIYQTSISKEPVKNLNEYEYISSGKQWSIFKKNKDDVVKIPNEIFEETNEKEYLENVKFAYKKICEYYPKKFVLETNFKRKNEINTIEQKYLPIKEEYKIKYSEKNKEVLRNIKNFLKSSLKILEKYQWLPDFEIIDEEKEIKFKKILLKSKTPIIYDWTSYYDIYRIHREKTEEEVEKKVNDIKKILEKIKL